MLKRTPIGFGSSILAVMALSALTACSSDDKKADATTGGTGGKGGTGGDGGTPSMMSGPPTTTPSIPVPDGGVEAPKATTDLDLPDAPDLGAIKYIPNRSSVRLYLPGLQGARDYRVFAVEDGVKVELKDKAEHVAGATMTCAGLRQRNQCDDGAIMPLKYHNEDLDNPLCEEGNFDRRPPVPAQLMQTVEVDGLKGDTTLVVEAVDRMCPFTGLWGSFHHEEPIGAPAVDLGGPMVDVVVDDKPYTLKRRVDSFQMYTEDEIRKTYGSMIFNGQEPNWPTFDKNSPNYPESPFIRQGMPAPASDPVVLARSVIKVTPTGHDKLPEGFTADDYFDDFDDDTDQPVKIRDTDIASSVMSVKVSAIKKWVLYDIGNPFSDFFVNRGQLNMTFGDPAQDSMSLQAMYPKVPVQLPTAANTYLHVTYEVQRNETARRYENLTLCGAETKGETYDGETPKSAPAPRPGFMNEDDTSRSSPLGWNCLLLVPRGNGYGVVPGGDIASHSDTSLKVTVVKAHPAPKEGEYDKVHVTSFATAFGPQQEQAYPKRYLRAVDDKLQPSDVWLDDQLNIWQKTRFDVFIRRDRVVIYVEGKQKICQDLTASPLTMAEGALGFWHILYHTSAELIEIRRGLPTDDPSTGQRHLMWNTPFADYRGYDNVGFRQDVGLPANFEASRCFAN